MATMNIITVPSGVVAHEKADDSRTWCGRNNSQDWNPKNKPVKVGHPDEQYTRFCFVYQSPS